MVTGQLRISIWVAARSLAIAAVASFLPASTVAQQSESGGTGLSLVGDKALRVEEIRVLPSADAVIAVGWSAQGDLLASSSGFGSLVTIWTAASGTRLSSFKRNSSPYFGRGITFLANDKELLTARNFSKDDQNVAFSLWDVQTGALLHNIDGPLRDGPSRYNNPQDFAASADGRIIASITHQLGDAVTVYSDGNWAAPRRLSINNPPAPAQHLLEDTALSVALSRDGRYLAVGRVSGTVLLFDLGDSSAPTRMIEVYDSPFVVGALAFSPNGKYLATGLGLRADGLKRETESDAQALENAPIKIWRVVDCSLLKSYPDREIADVGQLSWSADDRFLAVAAQGVRIIAPTYSNLDDAAIKFEEPVMSVSFAPQGLELAVATGSSVRIFNVHP